MPDMLQSLRRKYFGKIEAGCVLLQAARACSKTTSTFTAIGASACTALRQFMENSFDFPKILPPEASEECHGRD